MKELGESRRCEGPHPPSEGGGDLGWGAVGRSSAQPVLPDLCSWADPSLRQVLKSHGQDYLVGNKLSRADIQLVELLYYVEELDPSLLANFPLLKVSSVSLGLAPTSPWDLLSGLWGSHGRVPITVQASCPQVSNLSSEALVWGLERSGHTQDIGGRGCPREGDSPLPSREARAGCPLAPGP